jgi:hypothetical protein
MTDANKHLQTTQPQNKTVNRNDSYFTKKKYQYDAICPGNSRTVKDALIIMFFMFTMGKFYIG